MIDYGPPRPVLLRTQEPTQGIIQLGKVCRERSGKRWVYANNISAAYRAGQEYGVAPCVIKLMQAWGVRWIHYYDAENEKTYVSRLDALLANGAAKRYSYRPGYWYMPIRMWGKQAGQRRYEWVPANQVLTLPWVELVPMEEQTRLF